MPDEGVDGERGVEIKSRVDPVWRGSVASPTHENIMIGTIRKHSQTLWWIVIIAVIITFVAWIGPGQDSIGGVIGGRRNAGFGEVEGRPVTREQVQAAYQQVMLRERLAQRTQFPNEEARELAASQLVFTDRKLESMGIVPTAEVQAAAIREAYKDPQTGRSNYDVLLEQLKAMGVREELHLDMVRRDIGRQFLAEVLSIPTALVPPREVEAEYRRENEEAVASAVFFVSTNYLESVLITPDAVGQFFTNRMASYRIPEKFVLSYVRFPGAAFLAAAEQELGNIPDLSARLEALYNSRGAAAFLDDQGNPMAKDAALARLREEQVRAYSAARATEVAAEFYNELGELTPARAENLEMVAAKRGLQVEVTQPFAKTERPVGLEGLLNLGRELDGLNAEVPYSEPLTGLDGAFIVAIKARIPSIVPPLESVLARVTEDFRRAQARDAAISAGQAFRMVVTNAMAGGKGFLEVAAEQNLPVTDLPPFSLAMDMVPGLPPVADLNSLKDAAFGLQPGGVSTFNLGRDGGYVLFLKERKPVAEDVLKSGTATYAAELRSRRFGEAFYRWFESEWDRSSVSARYRPDPATNGPATQ